MNTCMSRTAKSVELYLSIFFGLIYRLITKNVLGMRKMGDVTQW